MLLEFLRDGLIFLSVAFGLGWPLAARLQLDPSERLVASVALGLLGVFLLAWAVYVFALPVAALQAIPGLAALALALNVRTVAAAWRDRGARDLIIAQLLVAGWSVGWLALVIGYSGGSLAGDWFGHWQRVLFFLERLPPEMLFNGFDALPSRPPLANVVIGVFIAPSQPGFATYQLIMTLLGCLAFSPAALLARRFGGPAAVAVLAVLFMVNPLFVQNTTYAWTKLPAAFFVLGALYFFLRQHDAGRPPAAGTLCGTLLAAGMLVHYSAGPYVILLAGAWLVLGWPRRRDRGWWQGTAQAALAGGLVLLMWFGWALGVYGWRGTFLTNTTATDRASTASAQLMTMALNVRDTLIPHFLRDTEFSIFDQPSPWGGWRDWFFQLYQVNLFLVFGSMAWAAILMALARDWRAAAWRGRAFWTVFLTGTALLGVVVLGARDTWGLAQICLQPLVLLGLAYLAARWTSLGRTWQRVLVAGAAIDFCAGIVLHFGIQSHVIDRWLVPGRSEVEMLLSYSQFALMNVRAKALNQWIFFGEYFASLSPWVFAALGALFATALARTQAPAPIPPAASVPARPTESTFAIAAAVTAAVAAILYAGMSWCAFPDWGWNEVRLAPAFALRHGMPLYPPLGGGPLSTWIYGPAGAVVNLPATLAASAMGALGIAGAINLLVLTAPLAAICFSARPLDTRGWPTRGLAFSLAVLLLPGTSLTLQVADHAAIALGLLACLVIAHEPRPGFGRLAAAAALTVLAIWAKQIALFLVPAHLVFLVWQREHGAAGRYLAAVVLLGTASLAGNAAVFGFSGLWLNLVEIPARLPWGDVRERLAGRLPQLLLLVVVPWPALAMLGAKFGWPAPDTGLGRLARALLCAAITMLPIGLFSFFKIGGDLNLLHSWFYLLPIFVLVLVTSERGPAASRWWRPALVAVMLACRASDFASLPATPQTARVDVAGRFARSNPEANWFPYQPLATFYSDGRLYHVEDGIATRDLAGLPLDEASFRRHLPPRLRAVIYPVTEEHPFALQLLPEFTQRTVTGPWAVYTRPAPP